MHILELIVDAIIPYCLVLLIIILILELGFKTFVEGHGLQTIIDISDYFIIAVFILDLLFKYIRVKSIPKFLRKYWLELIAVFPFFLLFRFAELAFGITGVSDTIKTAQSITHSTTELEKEAVALTEGEKVLTEGETLLKAERSVALTNFLRPLSRIPRFFKTLPQILHFYDKPTGQHHPGDIVDAKHV